MSAFWRTAAAAAALALCAQAQAQVRITGSFGGPTENGSSVHGSFDCTGAPTCIGHQTFTDRHPTCSNEITITGTATISGINVAGGSGPVSGTAVVGNGSYSDQRLPNGTCIIRPGSLQNLHLNWTGHYDATTQTGTMVFTDPGNGVSVPGTFKVELPPPFQMQVRTQIDANTATAIADIQYRPQDIGTTQSVFSFAMAPASRVQGGQAADVLKLGWAKDARKADTPIGCVLAQLNAAGQMVAVTSANLAAYLTGVLSAQGASVSILNGVPTSNVSGATFFVGYGSSGTAMINSGINRAAVTIPGSLTCEPAAPETGWWWNPLEDGRGFSIEKRGNNLFFASFLYDVSGRSTWYVSSGPASLEGTLYNGDLLTASGGQTLGGAYTRFPTLGGLGTVNLTFNNSRTGTLIWPGGTVPIQRFNIIPGGMDMAPVAGQPQSGWWWNESEAGRGFFLEFQGGWLDIAGYMYDDAGNSVWYLTVAEIGGTAAARSFSGTWWSYTGGQALTGPWRQNTRSNSNVAPLTITFTGPDTAVMTLPNNRTTNLTRHRF